jgi:hypothetical protein
LLARAHRSFASSALSRANQLSASSIRLIAAKLVPRAGHGFANWLSAGVGVGFANREGDAGLG